MIIDLIQRTPEWHAWRKLGITASMIPIIMGLSPYQTPYGLWAELVGLKEPDDLSKNFHVQRGVRDEPEARSTIENELGRPFLPVCVQADHNELFRASLDGLFDDGTEREALEIKCPCEKIYLDILANKGKSENFQMYAAQVQWQLNASDSRKSRLYFYLRGKRPINATINRNDAFIAKAEAKALVFWDLVQTKTPPQLIEGRDKVVYELEQKEEVANVWEANVERFKSLTAEVKELDAKKGDLEAELKGLKDYFSAQIPEEVQSFDKDGIKATKVERSGKIDQDKFVDALAFEFGVPKEKIELMQKKYRHSDTSYFRFTVSDESTAPATAQAEQSQDTTENSVTPIANVTLVANVTPEPKKETEVSNVVSLPRSASSYFENSAKSVYF